MSKVMSVRLPVEVVRRLRRRSRASFESASGLAARLVDEGLRMEAHPGIVFRPGPTGRRAALTGGPDVWEVVALLRSLEHRGDEAIEEAAEWLGLSMARVRLALAYYAGFSEAIDRQIRLNERMADEARRVWEAQQQVLG